GFGFCVALGLWLIGVDYAALWGFLATILRFVPYVGALGTISLTLAMAVIQFPSWQQPALVAAMILSLELLTNSLIEPFTYGRAAGVSTVALLISATYW